MRSVQRIGARGKARPRAQRRGQRLDSVPFLPPHAPDEVADPPCRESFRRWINRHEPRRVPAHRVVAAPRDLVLGHSEARAAPPSLEPAAQQHGRSFLQLVGEIGLVEPDRLHRPRVVHDLALEDREASSPGRPNVTAPNANQDRRLLADRELAYRSPALIVTVDEGQVLEQVADRLDSELCGMAGSRGPDPLEPRDRHLQRARVRQ